MTSTIGTIAALTSEEAVRVLADTADYQNRLPDPAQLRALETGLHRATASDTGLADYAQPGATTDAGDLARATLAHLAATCPDLVPFITGAIDDPGYAVRDPVTLTVGALVVLALQTEVKLARNGQGRWTFTVHTHPMRDSTLGYLGDQQAPCLPLRQQITRPRSQIWSHSPPFSSVRHVQAALPTRRSRTIAGRAERKPADFESVLQATPQGSNPLLSAVTPGQGEGLMAGL